MLPTNAIIVTVKCRTCKTTLTTQEVAAYDDRCEMCWCAGQPLKQRKPLDERKNHLPGHGPREHA